MAPAALNLGCGVWSYPNAVNLDRVALPGVDVVHDIDMHPWPFDPETFDEVWGTAIFEHIEDPIGFMADAWRVLKPSGLLFLIVPHWQSENSYTDPTHRRHCTERTWDYWCPGTELHAQFGAAYAGQVAFEKEQVQQVDDDIHVRLRRL